MEDAVQVQIEELIRSNCHPEQAPEIVRTQIIPFLIKSFSSTPHNLLNSSSQDILQTLNQFKTNLRNNGYGPFIHRHNSQGQPIFLLNVQEWNKIKQVIILFQTLQRMVMRNSINIFNSFKSSSKENRLRLAQIVKNTAEKRIRYVILQFRRHKCAQKNKQFLVKSIQKIWKYHMRSNWNTIWIPGALARNIQALQEKIKYFPRKAMQMIERIFTKHLHTHYTQIKEYTLLLNPWRNKWVHRFARNSPLNLQISLWRISEYTQICAKARKKTIVSERQFSENKQQVFPTHGNATLTTIGQVWKKLQLINQNIDVNDGSGIQEHNYSEQKQHFTSPNKIQTELSDRTHQWEVNCRSFINDLIHIFQRKVFTLFADCFDQIANFNKNCGQSGGSGNNASLKRKLSLKMEQKAQVADGSQSESQSSDDQNGKNRSLSNVLSAILESNKEYDSSEPCSKVVLEESNSQSYPSSPSYCSQSSNQIKEPSNQPKNNEKNQ